MASQRQKAVTSRKPAKKARGKASSADIVDEQLARYREMRDFTVTAEPSGGAGNAPGKARKKPATGLPFVIQKHAASHLHYDFRLGWNGVLKSWACAKGPSYSPKDRRLAVEVEDHPMEYGGFEGIIPKGQYGGGTVMVWDQGTWTPQPGHEDVDGGLRDGSLKFTMSGQKMRGKWTLVRMHPRPGEKKPAWLLIKEHDEFERSDAPVTENEPDSAVTGRSLEQIAAAEDHVWQSNKTAYLRDPSIKVPKGQPWHRQQAKEPAVNAPTKAATKAATKTPIKKATKASTKTTKTAVGTLTATSPDSGDVLRECPRETQLEFVKPQLALEATSPPERAGWLHELKLDGYRIQARKAGAKVALLTRSGLDWTHRMTAAAEAVGRMSAKRCTLDGEVVVLKADGNSNFAALQASFQSGDAHPLTFFAFDLLHLEGHNTRMLPLIERKRLLAGVLPAQTEALRLSEHIETAGNVMFAHACALHAEGIISKRADAIYRSGRSGDWLKSKCLHEQEFVVAGYTLSTEGKDRIGSLLLGYYEPPSGQDAKARLIYAGRTGTGFTQTLKRDLLTQLKALERKTMALAAIPAAARRGAIWVDPTLVAQVRFATWTADNLVRQAAFLGLREDKPASEVCREEATVAPRPKAARASRSEDAGAKETRSVSAKLAANGKPPSHTPSIRLTHPDKVLDAESGLTKRQLATYYEAIAPQMLPHIAGRPLSLVRCPDGAGEPCFFQKHVNAMLPKSVGTVEVPDKKTGVPEPYITLSTAETLASLAQLGVLEIHPWGSRNDDLEHPDRLILDLDPDEAIAWPTLCEAAAEVRQRLKRCGLTSFLKLTGGKGLHIVAPLTPKADWTTVKAGAHKFALALERDNPKLYLSRMSKAARKGKIYCDYLRNERGATAVAPYSPRARAGVGVSLPVPWTTLKQSERPLFRVVNFADWQRQLKPDPWAAMMSTIQTFDADTFAQL